MEIRKIVHLNVKPDGTFEHCLGAVRTEGGVFLGLGEGCGLPECHCSDGYWITIMLPRNEDGIVEGISARFDDKKEYDKFIRTHELRLRLFER